MFSLPTALPLMNGYSSYDQHHSGKAVASSAWLWPPNASLGFGLVCEVAEGGSDSASGLGEVLLWVWEVVPPS